MLATVAAKQMCTPNRFVHRCMINSLVEKQGDTLALSPGSSLRARRTWYPLFAHASNYSLWYHENQLGLQPFESSIVR